MRAYELEYPPNIDAQIQYHLDKQEEIDDRTVGANDPDVFKKYMRIAASHYVIEIILKNLKLQQQKQVPNQIFLFEYDQNKTVVAALHASVDVEKKEIRLKWLGSTVKGGGSKLILKLKQIAREHKIKGISLTSKFNSDEFYQKMGAKKTGDPNALQKAFDIGNKWWLDGKT